MSKKCSTSKKNSDEIMRIFDFLSAKLLITIRTLLLKAVSSRVRLEELIEAETEEKLIAAKRRRSAARRSREDDILWNNWRNYGNHPLDSI